MALRTNTIVYAFPTSASAVVAATRLEFNPPITLYITESSSRTFRSVMLEVCQRGNDAAGTSTTSWLMGIKLGAAAFSDVTTTDTITNSSEQQSFIFSRDVTSYFASNFGAGTSQTCQVATNTGASSIINTTAKLRITYEYDDSTNGARMKTIRIPIQSSQGPLTNALARVGSGSYQIPKLTGSGGLLPEDGIEVRNMFFELVAQEAAAAVTDFNLAVALDSEAEHSAGNLEHQLNSSPWMKYIWVRNDMALSGAHKLKARSTTNGTIANLGAILYVTYEYNETRSTTILNHICFPAFEEAGTIGGTAALYSSRQRTKFFIPEPGPITIQQSGIYFTYNAAASLGTLTLKTGTSASNTYIPTAGTIQCGQWSVVHRIDNAITLSRGENYFDTDWSRSTNNASQLGSSWTGLVMLNYWSGRHALGIGAHNHTTWWAISGSAADLTLMDWDGMAPIIPETNYFINNAGFEIGLISRSTGWPVTLAAMTQTSSGEDHLGRWVDLYAGSVESDNSLGVHQFHCPSRNFFKIHPTDPRPDRVGIELQRKYRLNVPTSAWAFGNMIVTYHSISASLTGSITGYTGSGADIKVNFYTADKKDFVLRTTTTSGGTFSVVWYDDTKHLFAEAKQDASHVGRSDTGTMGSL